MIIIIIIIIIIIGQKSEKSPGDLRRLVVTQTPPKKPSANAGVKNSQKSKIITIIVESEIVFSYIDEISFEVRFEKAGMLLIHANPIITQQYYHVLYYIKGQYYMEERSK